MRYLASITRWPVADWFVTHANPAFPETEETQQKLNDALIQSRLANALNSQIQLKDKRNHIYVSVEQGRARLYGQVTERRALTLAEEIASGHSGLSGIQNDIALVSGFNGYPTPNDRAKQLPVWLHRYNWHRPHGSLKSKPPINRLDMTSDNLLRLHT